MKLRDYVLFSGFSCLSLFSALSYSTEMLGTVSTVKKNKFLPYISMFGGLNIIQSGQAELVTFDGDIADNFTPSGESVLSPIAGLGLGVVWEHGKGSFWLSGGAELAYTRAVGADGLVQPMFLVAPDLDTLTYTYTVSSISILFVVQFGWDIARFIEPYVTGGVGASFNEGYDFNEAPTDPTSCVASMNAMFQPNTQTELAYFGGAGIGFKVTDSTMLAVEYRYSIYGAASLKPTVLQETDQGLSLGSIKAHTVIARMTVVI